MSIEQKITKKAMAKIGQKTELGEINTYYRRIKFVNLVFVSFIGTQNFSS